MTHYGVYNICNECYLHNHMINYAHRIDRLPALQFATCQCEHIEHDSKITRNS